RLKTHSKTQKKSADLVSNKLRIGVFQRYQMKCKSVSKKSPRYMYAYAALRVSVQRWQLDLAVLAKSREEETTRPTLKELAAKLSGGVNGYSR
ncbi:hypothetical protein, partial [Escherichia coli]